MYVYSYIRLPGHLNTSVTSKLTLPILDITNRLKHFLMNFYVLALAGSILNGSYRNY
jgi:hypothetical protein